MGPRTDVDDDIASYFFLETGFPFTPAHSGQAAPALYRPQNAARGASSIYIKTAFMNSAQTHVSCNTDHTIQDGKKQASSVQGLLQRDEK